MAMAAELTEIPAKDISVYLEIDFGRMSHDKEFRKNAGVAALPLIDEFAKAEVRRKWLGVSATGVKPFYSNIKAHGWVNENILGHKDHGTALEAMTSGNSSTLYCIRPRDNNGPDEIVCYHTMDLIVTDGAPSGTLKKGQLFHVEARASNDDTPRAYIQAIMKFQMPITQGSGGAIVDRDAILLINPRTGILE
ncbi:MAG: hypothetical protein AAFX79_13470 [Planctomycetota bacterium]